MRNKYLRILLSLSFALLFLSSAVRADEFSDFIMEGNFYYKEKDYKTAIKAYEGAASVEGEKDIKVYYNLGLAYKKIKNYHSSIKNFEKFLESATEKKQIKAVKNLVRTMSEDIVRPTTEGKLTHYEVWDGWVMISGDVIVPKGITLTIKPGALIMFTPNKSKFDLKIPFLDEDETEYLSSLVIRGTLIAEGEKENEILFSNSFEDVTSKKIGLWGGIIFDGSEGSSLKYAKVERAKNGVVLRSVPKLEFSKNIFVKNEVSVKLIDKSSIVIDDSIFYRNELGIEFSGFSEAKIIYCNFTKNNYAIKALDNSWPRVTNSTFDENSCGICTYGETFSAILDNTFSKGTFGVSMTGKSKANIKSNSFTETGSASIPSGTQCRV